MVGGLATEIGDEISVSSVRKSPSANYGIQRFRAPFQIFGEGYTTSKHISHSQLVTSEFIDLTIFLSLAASSTSC